MNELDRVFLRIAIFYIDIKKHVMDVGVRLYL